RTAIPPIVDRASPRPYRTQEAGLRAFMMASTGVKASFQWAAMCRMPSLRSGSPEGVPHDFGWDYYRLRHSRITAGAGLRRARASRRRPPALAGARPEREAGERPVRGAGANLLAQGRGRQALCAALDVRRVPLGQRGRDGQHPVAGAEGEG